MEPVRRIGNGANFGLSIDKTEAGTEGLHTARGQQCPRTKRSGKRDAKPCLPGQDETILPGLAVRVKKLLAAIVNWDHSGSKRSAALIVRIGLPFQNRFQLSREVNVRACMRSI